MRQPRARSAHSLWSRFPFGRNRRGVLTGGSGEQVVRALEVLGEVDLDRVQVGDVDRRPA
ncbi:hypothetical protein BACI9J_620002 [Bacillus altitudinis]|nr:hypothetical protein BACI9J_620002 [Bacillus altitudinis]